MRYNKLVSGRKWMINFILSCDSLVDYIFVAVLVACIPSN